MWQFAIVGRYKRPISREAELHDMRRETRSIGCNETAAMEPEDDWIFWIVGRGADEEEGGV